MAIPRKDADLLFWSENFSTHISATPLVFNITAPQAASYATLHDAYAAALSAASAVGARSKALTAAKSTAKDALLVDARQLYGFVQSSLTVTDANKALLDVNVRKVPPTPVPAPTSAPAIEIVSATGHIVRLKFKNTEVDRTRAMPEGVIGLNLFSFVGPTPPAGAEGWKFEGGTGRLRTQVAFDTALAPGTKVWFSAFWFNRRKESGPAAAPIGTNLPGGSTLLAA